MKKFLTIALCSVLFITGCSKKNVESGGTETITPLNVGVIKSEIKVSDDSDIFFSSSDNIPIIRNHSICGLLKVNRITRLGIWDWYNQAAVTNGVKYSYSVNFTIDFSSSIKKTEDAVKILSSAYLVDGSGGVVGKPCEVGWSGFEKIAQLYDSSPSMTVEIGVQPERVLEENDSLELRLQTSDGAEFDPIFLRNEELVNAVEGPTLQTAEVDVESINGAIYSVGVANVFFGSNPTTAGSNDDDLKDYYDFSYSVWYKQAPSNSREVLCFDSYDGNALQTKLVLGVQSDVDSSLLYENDESALWFKFKDSSETESYVTTGDAAIKPGIEAQYSTNRLVPETTTVQPTYLRFRVEFPEEQKARSLQERLDFNGRFLVFQLPIGARELQSIYEESSVE